MFKIFASMMMLAVSQFSFGQWQSFNENPFEDVTNICVRYETKQVCQRRDACSVMCAATAAALTSLVPVGGWISGAIFGAGTQACGHICAAIDECKNMQVCVEWTQP